MMRSQLLLCFTLGGIAAFACSSGDDSSTNGGSGTSNRGGDGGSADAGEGDTSGGSSRDGGAADNILNLGQSHRDAGSADGVCREVSAEGELAPLYLSFAFDVSGSMGALDRPNWWHDPAVKWEPVVAATTAFFEDETATRISASMTFFPARDNDVKCDAITYETPEVEMQALPSDAFAAALDGYEAEVGMPLAGGDWRGRTPTLAAVHGLASYIRDQRDSVGESAFAAVLVTDGYPQGCDSGIAEVALAIEALAEEGVPTYVIGVENPTTPPDELPEGWADWGDSSPDEPLEQIMTLDDLNQLATAGGTEAAFLIDTGNPSATQTAFGEAVSSIRARAIPCELGIPPHPTEGESFDEDKIDVSLGVGEERTRFSYDPTCELDAAWHYDDVDDPSSIELCPATCLLVQTTSGAELSVDFLCEPRDDVPR